MEEMSAPFECHVFVCTNDRKGERKSCADGDSVALRKWLKDEGKKRVWAGRVRVSQCGCLGLCGKGPNVILYPQKIWFSGVSKADGEDILTAVESILESTEE